MGQRPPSGGDVFQKTRRVGNNQLGDMDVEVVSGEKWEKDPDRGNAVLGVSGGKMEESGVSWDLIRRSQLEQRE